MYNAVHIHIEHLEVKVNEKSTNRMKCIYIVNMTLVLFGSLLLLEQRSPSFLPGRILGSFRFGKDREEDCGVEET